MDICINIFIYIYCHNCEIVSISHYTESEIRSLRTVGDAYLSLSSGLRYDLIARDWSPHLMERMCRTFTPTSWLKGVSVRNSSVIPCLLSVFTSPPCDLACCTRSSLACIFPVLCVCTVYTELLPLNSCRMFPLVCFC